MAREGGNAARGRRGSWWMRPPPRHRSEAPAPRTKKTIRPVWRSASTATTAASWACGRRPPRRVDGDLLGGRAAASKPRGCG
ncbi:hypothetical protein GUJ93_ZPchr0002g23700 [Zizania palustris]|uniref:Uncharacterized protein n=1 Tax=Zizania palustris TaxID=103762 RepID=A0A8J5VUV5_ZIZPA|nr:hypothetical protein GUJ93_ZPchr0002g23700 [Zizania palustris]